MKQIIEDSQGWPTEAVEKSKNGYLIPVQINELGDVRLPLETEVDVKFANDIFELHFKIVGPAMVDIPDPEALDDESKTIKVKLDASKAKLSSAGSGSYGAFSGIRFQESKLQFFLENATGSLKDGTLVIYEGVIGSP